MPIHVCVREPLGNAVNHYSSSMCAHVCSCVLMCFMSPGTLVLACSDAV